uniref:Uncharacterized protein n=1 Tax=Arundo donax TaxID=35708 RepID=A0A0A9FA38_ARUDO
MEAMSAVPNETLTKYAPTTFALSTRGSARILNDLPASFAR